MHQSHHCLGVVPAVRQQVPVQLCPALLVGVPVDGGIGIFGYRIEAARPVSVGWEIAGQQGVAITSGVPSG